MYLSKAFVGAERIYRSGKR